MRKSTKKTQAKKKASPPAKVAEALQPLRGPAARTPKRATNLTLDPAAVERGEKFGEKHGTSVSKLVTGFLYALPSSNDAVVAELTPAVRRLYGLAAGSGAERDDYRAHLLKKYDG